MKSVAVNRFRICRGVCRVVGVWSLFAAVGCQSVERDTAVTQDVPETSPETQVFTVTDPGLNDMAMATVAAPVGWTIEPQIERLGAAYFSIPVAVDVRVAAPDGRAVRWYPQTIFEYRNPAVLPAWSATPSGKIALSPPESLGRWLAELIETNPAPGVAAPQLVSQTPLPQAKEELEKLHRALLESYEQFNASMSGPWQVSLRYDATHITVAYTRDGNLEREDFLVLYFRYDEINAQGVAQSGSWGLMVMQSKAGPKALGATILTDPQLDEVIRSWAVQEPWALEIDRFNRALERAKTHDMMMRRPELSETPHAAEMYALKRQQYAQSLEKITTDAWAEAAALANPQP